MELKPKSPSGYSSSSEQVFRRRKRILQGQKRVRNDKSMELAEDEVVEREEAYEMHSDQAGGNPIHGELTRARRKERNSPKEEDGKQVGGREDTSPRWMGREESEDDMESARQQKRQESEGGKESAREKNRQESEGDKESAREQNRQESEGDTESAGEQNRQESEGDTESAREQNRQEIERRGGKGGSFEAQRPSRFLSYSFL
ncbi:hypothetical protein H6P81_003302 [Aristolochia fimbriata]|uniref:Uncharacterized protein n=1 Tax=Aristolochia fimbriata TaxID=158543 RepID=A0AAV7FDW5_ARIFI|nr:hypothetical protein H6P81_003302 [Aristolochia fimbriata]